MKADSDAALESFGKNEQVREVLWIFFRRADRPRAGSVFGSGGSSAGGWGYYGNGGVKIEGVMIIKHRFFLDSSLMSHSQKNRGGIGK